MTPILRFVPWAIVSSLAVGYVSHSFLIGECVFIEWWIAGNIAHEICAAIKERNQ